MLVEPSLVQSSAIVNEFPWEAFGLEAATLLGASLLWAVLGAIAGTVLAVALAAGLAKLGAMRVSFTGARFARALTYGLFAIVGFTAGATLGAIHGGAERLERVVRAPAFAASAFRPAAGPIAVGLAHTVAIQTGVDPTPLAAGTAPIPGAPLRAALVEPTGTAVVAGLRRVPQLQGIASSRAGGAILAFLGEALAGDRAESMLDAAGLFDAMAEMAEGLAGDGIALGALATEVERTMLPAFTATWIDRLETQALLGTAVPAALILLGVVSLLWMVEGGVRWWQRRKKASATTPPAAEPAPIASPPAGQL